MRRQPPSTVVTTFADIGLDALVGGRAGFVNVTRDFVMHGFVTLLPAGRVALELHRTEALDPEVLAELRRLGDLGYTIVARRLRDARRQPAAARGRRTT